VRKGQFMPMKRFLLLSLLLLVISAPDANADVIPPGWTVPTESQTATFELEDGSDIAEVDCEVFEYEPGLYEFEYVYSYQITNVSDTHLSFFSVKILEGAGVYDSPAPDFVGGTGVEPDNWHIVNSPAQSIEGIFYNTISPGVSSAILWFASDNKPGYSGQGALVGLSSGYVFATTEGLMVPIPEPATLVLLVAGGLIAFTRKRRPV